jgi:hypothetical protein
MAFLAYLGLNRRHEDDQPNLEIPMAYFGQRDSTLGMLGDDNLWTVDRIEKPVNTRSYR